MIMGFHNGILYSWERISSGSCPLSNPVAPPATNSTPALCFYTSTTFNPENWVFQGQYPTGSGDGAIEIVFPSGSCSGYKYIYTTGNNQPPGGPYYPHILRATSAAGDWNFHDIIGNINFPGQGIPPNLPPDTAERRGSFATADIGGNTRLFYSNYNDHSYNPPSGPPGGLVWHSDTCGDTWSPPIIFGGREVHSVNADPTNNSNIYVVIDIECAPDGTSCPSVAPLGIWQSTDGGNSFNHVPSKYLPIDLIFPIGSNLFGEADGGTGPLLSWNKISGGDIQSIPQYPSVPNGVPSWNGSGAGGIGLTSEGNIFLQTTPGTLREGIWYFAPPSYNTPVLLEDLAPPIESVTASNGVAVVTTQAPHFIQPGDFIVIEGVNPFTFNTSGFVPVNVTAPSTFSYSCTGCPTTQNGTGGVALKDGIIFWPGRTVEVNDPTTGLSYLYNSNFRFGEPHFMQVQGAWDYIDVNGDVRDLWCCYNGNWSSPDITNLIGAPKAETGTALSGYTDSSGNIQLLHVNSSQHLELLAYTNFNGGWTPNDLTTALASSGVANPATWTPLFMRTQGTWDYFDVNGDLHELWCCSNGNWSSPDITNLIGAPKAESGTALSGYTDSSGNVRLLHINASQHLELLAYTNSTGAWTATDLTAALASGGVANPATWTPLFMRAQGTWDYFDANGDLHELWCCSNGNWSSPDITFLIGAPKAESGSPLSGYTDGSGNVHLLFINSSQHIEQYQYTNLNGVWVATDLTAALASGSVANPASWTPLLKRQ